MHKICVGNEMHHRRDRSGKQIDLSDGNALRFLLLIAFESHRYITNIWSIDIKLLSIICYPTSLSSMLTASVTLMSSLADVCIQPACNKTDRFEKKKRWIRLTNRLLDADGNTFL